MRGAGSGRPLVPASAALIAIPLAASRTMLLLNVTYSVTHQVQRPSWLADFNTMAVPFWPDVQTCSKVLPSTSTRRAFFSSNAFLAATPRRLPRQPFGAQVAANFDVGRHEFRRSPDRLRRT